ncbi:hypothetical protein FZ934_16960 [Rhizobium grahamii]|uniref:Apea-like HEPN domain-containing protein n=1 Tax=Rhizobium grahamii TaxID=1120045 RepID=A0A5Q0C7K6_9HYPH|nr:MULTISPECIES: hypothetical protein [Rhizobium]QFY61936.1 hypothetical protein FZ934_16960 [Rhizobium grahamii]QRM48888.1 hypothetical protein F3Y33_05935 [Rhizobium sp. BG6]
MKTLLNEKYEFIALSQKIFGRQEDFSDWGPVLGMSGQVAMDHAPHSTLTIEQREGSYLRKLAPNIDTITDTTKVLVFQITLDRKLVATYSERARELIIAQIKADDRYKRINVAQAVRRSKGTMFHGELIRDFELKAYTILVAAHLADPLGVSTHRVVSHNGPDTATSGGFKMGLGPRASFASDVAMRKLSPRTVFDFLLAKPKEIAEEPKSQFMKGLSYISQSFRSSQNPLVAFMWSLASIEAMLSTTSDKANSGALELRLRALLDENHDQIVGKFRELYKYRNALLHGNVSLPFSFDSRNLFGFNGVKHSNTAPYDIAAFTYALSLKILQRFVELGRYDVTYDVSVSKG